MISHPQTHTMSIPNVVVEPSGRKWQVRLVHAQGVSFHVWTFKHELEARQLADKLRSALTP